MIIRVVNKGKIKYIKASTSCSLFAYLKSNALYFCKVVLIF